MVALNVIGDGSRTESFFSKQNAAPKLTARKNAQRAFAGVNYLGGVFYTPTFGFLVKSHLGKGRGEEIYKG